MYYHSRPLKYVEYGKVYPPPYEKIDGFLGPAYRWLGNYCGYCPQVWLSRSNLSITGYKNSRMIKKRQYVIQKRSNVKEANDSVLFGFDIIKGFPISYIYWEFILMYIDNECFKNDNKSIIIRLNEIIDDYTKDGFKKDEWQTEILAWDSCRGDFNLFLNKYVFVECDQVVVPSLNLKCAKQIICRDEKQKKRIEEDGVHRRQN